MIGEYYLRVYGVIRSTQDKLYDLRSKFIARESELEEGIASLTEDYNNRNIARIRCGSKNIAEAIKYQMFEIRRKKRFKKWRLVRVHKKVLTLDRMIDKTAPKDL